MAADMALKERFKKQSELMEYAREVLQLLNSDDLLQKSRENAETLDKINCKLVKGKENVTSTIESK